MARTLLTDLAWLTLAIVALGCEQPPAGPVNLLLISVDTLRADHLATYGYSRETAPRLSRLAAQGVLFETVVAESSWTLPAHMSLFTGLSSGVHGVSHDGARLDPARTTLARYLRESGYRSEAYVSAPYVHPIFGFDQGFDRYVVLGSTLYDEEGFEHDQAWQDPAWQQRRVDHDRASHQTQTSEELADRASEAIARLAGDPFLLFVHMFDAHFDYTPPESYWRRFDPDYAGDFDPRGYASNGSVNENMPKEELEHVEARYDGEILWIDEHIGRILDALEARGVADRTLVVVTSDHGEEFFEHGGKGHRRTLYDEQLLVPLVMRLPGVLPAGKRLSMQARTIDVLPSVLELMGIEPREEIMGSSLIPFVRGKRKPQDLPALSFLFRPGRDSISSLRIGGRKLIMTMPLAAGGGGLPGLEYFDLEADPYEMRPQGKGPEVLRAFGALTRRREAEVEIREALRSGADTSVVVPRAMREALEELGYLWEGDE